MKKLITIAFAAMLAVFGAAPAFAQNDNGNGNGQGNGNGPLTVEDCAESDLEIEGCELLEDTDPTPGGVYPPDLVEPDEGPIPTTAAPTTAAPATTQPPVGNLPATGSSGSNGLMQVGALLLVGGLVVFVAARRRNPATAS